MSEARPASKPGARRSSITQADLAALRGNQYQLRPVLHRARHPERLLQRGDESSGS
jgi:hypothetical protein